VFACEIKADTEALNVIMLTLIESAYIYIARYEEPVPICAAVAVFIVPNPDIDTA